ncbi:barstar family protein [Comamonas testosteroni]
MEILIDGDTIEKASDFHRAFASALGIESFYGENLHALWDVLSASIERPVTLTWTQSGKSKKALGADFDAIVDVLRRVELQDEKFGWVDRFSFVLE